APQQRADHDCRGLNSVPQSKSMCARRIFELSSSKTAVVSVESEAISGSYAADEVFTVQTQHEAVSKKIAFIAATTFALEAVFE
ncbi:hypothetical protein ACKLTP_19080, partial [Paenarthrobacter ureafaciens]